MKTKAGAGWKGTSAILDYAIFIKGETVSMLKTV